ncbi:TauD/TfdA family dioxygenase [Halomonas eurihalina]|uniref:TauD/TfdA family dioxygenase n=1 Tax=Halomonas eurihalina TaxID=42566 RepID=A0A5D9DCP1_HALER|nr:TauD/TfdA family dioxygenase [Halomonas eurihalina]MDR5859276.1 TauD/TfdA family dioxygenase [Halomonas eurihalina]TZG40900.1 TauD/TfdA family dioxygenase [Halomonas eurihalina]
MDENPLTEANLLWSGRELIHNRQWQMDLSLCAGGLEDYFSWIKKTLGVVGLALIKNVPFTALPETEAAQAFLNFGLNFGCPVSQSEKFDFLGRVTDRGSDIRNHTARGYESTAELPFHNDRCDLLALLCIRQAPIGGETRVVSAVAACQRLMATDPKLAQVLFEPVPFDLRDTKGDKCWGMMPVFSYSTGVFVARYVRRFIEASQRFEDAPRLTEHQIAAFDALDSILHEPDMAMDLRLEAGDLLLIDNHRLLHARSEFEDKAEAEAKRLLLRLWLCWTGSPELPAMLAPTYGRTGSGSFRSGVWPTTCPLSSFPSDLTQARQRVKDIILSSEYKKKISNYTTRTLKAE